MASLAIYEMKPVSSQRIAMMLVCMAIVHYCLEGLRRGRPFKHATVSSPIIMKFAVSMAFLLSEDHNHCHPWALVVPAAFEESRALPALAWSTNI